jgi:hypothetical protein
MKLLTKFLDRGPDPVSEIAIAGVDLPIELIEISSKAFNVLRLRH